MRHLSISGSSSTEWHLPQNITALIDIQRLELANFAVPNWVSNLTDLKHLTLLNCGCINYPELEEMPNLVVLRLMGNESCREIPKALGKSSMFPKLRYLHVEYFPLLEEFSDLEDGVMAVLEKFCFASVRA
ncbi:hypothetical protein SUGI_0982370 [Cryptomeria japonica]|nr:hypothetical protein SUGI_0982370 [Cryptomeria japonica]